MSDKKPEAFNDNSIGFVLNDVARLIRCNFNNRARDLELTQTQWRALAYILRNEGIKQSHLANVLEVQPISVARLIDRMEATGWVDRRPDPSDRRAVNLYLTDKAEPIIKKMQKYGAEVRDQAMAGLSEKEQQDLMANLIKVRKNLVSN